MHNQVDELFSLKKDYAARVRRIRANQKQSKSSAVKAAETDAHMITDVEKRLLKLAKESFSVLKIEKYIYELICYNLLITWFLLCILLLLVTCRVTFALSFGYRF